MDPIDSILLQHFQTFNIQIVQATLLSTNSPKDSSGFYVDSDNYRFGFSDGSGITNAAQLPAAGCGMFFAPGHPA